MNHGKIPLGITDDEVALGSHLIHFWQTDEEFESGVRFLRLGLENESECCVLFGHDEANQRALEILRKNARDLDRMLAERRLVVLRRELPAATTLANIESVFEAAVRNGATVIRYLGNFGIGHDPLPGKGAEEVIELESGATALALRYPCVMVCMYDVNTASGHLILAGGFATHPVAIWNGALRQNPYCECEPVSSFSTERVA